MQVQHQTLSVLSDENPLLATTANTSSQQRVILQERSANQSHDYYSSTASSQLKQYDSPGPTENTHAQRATVAGTYHTGNLHASHVGLAGFHVEKSEKQIRYELDRIYRMLARSERYQKYREKQPVLSPAEVIARDAAEEKERARKEAAGEPPDKKDNTVWPDFLEHAFWKGKTSRPYDTCMVLFCFVSSILYCLSTPYKLCSMSFVQILMKSTQHSFDGRRWGEKSTCSKANSEDETN